MCKDNLINRYKLIEKVIIIWDKKKIHQRIDKLEKKEKTPEN